MANSTPPPGSPYIVPPGVTNAEINIANEPSSSPVPPDEAPVANLFGGSLGVTQNKRPSIRRDKSGHTPARKKRGDTLSRASSVKVRIAIQDALAGDMLSLHVDDPCDESSQRRVTAVVTPDGDCGDADGDCGDAESDDEDYSPDPVAPPKKQEKRVKNKTSDPKVILDRNFMTILRPEIFCHEPFRKGSSNMYSEDDIDRFDAEFRKQIHFNFSATRNTQKQKQSQEATRASRLRDIDLDVIQRDTSTVTTNRSNLSHYILEDILDCPPGSRFIICITTDAADVERGV
jgi:hypothetical protein